MNPETLVVRPEDVDSEESRFDGALDNYATLRARRDSVLTYGKSLIDRILGRPSELGEINVATADLINVSHTLAEVRTRLRTQNIANPDQYANRTAQDYSEELRNNSDDITEALQQSHTTQGIADVIYRGYLNLDSWRYVTGVALFTAAAVGAVQGPNAALVTDLGIVLGLSGGIDFASRAWLAYTTRHQNNIFAPTSTGELLRRRESFVEGLVTGDNNVYPVAIDQELEDRSADEIRTTLRRNSIHIQGVPSNLVQVVRQRAILRAATERYEDLPELNRSFERARRTRALRWAITLGTAALVFLHGQARPENCGSRTFPNPDNVVGAIVGDGRTDVHSIKGIVIDDTHIRIYERPFVWDQDEERIGTMTNIDDKAKQNTQDLAQVAKNKNHNNIDMLNEDWFRLRLGKAFQHLCRGEINTVFNR